MFEQALQQSIFSQNSERTFIDKILSKDDVERMRDLIKKPKLQREDILELMYMLSSKEMKMVNYSDWERYIQLKLFVWIRDFVKVAEILFNYQDDLKRKETLCECGGFKLEGIKKEGIIGQLKECDCKEFKQVFKMSDRTKKILFNNERLIEHNLKFIMDLYLNIARTTLSLGATGFKEALTNKYELSYPQQSSITPVAQEKKSWFSMGGK